MAFRETTTECNLLSLSQIELALRNAERNH